MSTLVFQPFRAEQVGVDALWAFVFLSNWWFGYEGTDYFRAAADAVSPLQHYWSLSIEEQFYFVWPAVIFAISVIVANRALTNRHRLRIAACVMAGIVTLSFGWAVYKTETNAAWAYFDTFSRVWELGIGALLACSVGVLAQIPRTAKTVLSWSGLAFIAASLFVISEGSSGFPAPWALLPTLGAAMVIAAGVRGEPRYQAFLRNPLSGYVGNISYSLYLVHWPVIVFAGSLMDVTGHYYVVVLTLGFGLAIGSYHLIENPLRKADSIKLQGLLLDLRKRRYKAQPASGYAALAALALLVCGSTTFVTRPEANQVTVPPALAFSAPEEAEQAGNHAVLSRLGSLHA